MLNRYGIAHPRQHVGNRVSHHNDRLLQQFSLKKHVTN